MLVITKDEQMNTIVLLCMSFIFISLCMAEKVVAFRVDLNLEACSLMKFQPLKISITIIIQMKRFFNHIIIIEKLLQNITKLSGDLSLCQQSNKNM